LARQGAIPFGTDRSLFDDHDFVSRYHEAETHRILLDHEELEDHGKSLWYFAVVNQEDPNNEEDALTYTIKASLSKDVACLSASTSTICSGHGTCDRTLGRCTCAAAYTGDDCGDAGVFPLVLQAPAATTTNVAGTVSATHLPTIPADEWVYYSLSIGCNTTIKVEFTTTSAGSRPLIVMEKDRLPLMVDATHEYDDYYSGVKTFGHRQIIRIAPCQQNVNIGGQLRCYIHQLFPGTNWKTGSPAPGEWYIGIYNDPNIGGVGGSQPNPIVDYTLTVTQEQACSDTTPKTQCASGFRNDVQNLCQTTCPGMHPEQHEIFTNKPMDVPAPCDNHGLCSTDGATCACSSSYSGLDCSITCPSADTSTICSGHGSCPSVPTSSTDPPTCTCDAGFGGMKCDISCPTNCSGHGTCAAVSGNPICKCTTGWAGNQCNYQCPTGDNIPCSGHGKCTSKQTEGSSTETAFCQCDATHTGQDCSISCPLGIGNAVCSGHARGTCSLRNNAGTCACLDGYDGDACEDFQLCPGNCNGVHGECIGTALDAKQCQCKRGWVGAGCALQCPVTSLSGAVCDGHGQCSLVNGNPICTCDPTHTGELCNAVCPINGTAVCNNQGTCMVDASKGTDGVVATCACLDGFGGATCSEPALTIEEATKKAQNKVDSRSIIIASVVSVLSLFILAIATFILRRTRSRLRQYEVTFGTDALLSGGDESAGGGSGGDGGESGSGRGRGRNIKRTSREGSESMAAEDVLAQGSMSMAVQMQDINVTADV